MSSRAQNARDRSNALVRLTIELIACEIPFTHDSQKVIARRWPSDVAHLARSRNVSKTDVTGGCWL
jgi:hypothetical protein